MGNVPRRRMTPHVLTIALALAVIFACGRSTSVSTTERSEYEGTAERTLAALGARIDSLKAEADTASYEIQARVEDLVRKRDVAREKLARLKDAAGGAWNDVKQETSEALEELKQGVERIRGTNDTT